MGTNYYLMNPPAKYRDYGRDLHIGKSSAGWAFSLHVIPEIGLNGWEEWEKVLSRKTAKIRDEYDTTVTFAELKDRILHKPAMPKMTDDMFRNTPGESIMMSLCYSGYRNVQDFLTKNHAWEDERGLLRAQPTPDGRHCLWNHPTYSFDAITGVFC